MYHKLVAVLVVLFAGLLFSQPALASNVTVDCSGQTPGAFTSLQAAIDSLDLVGPHTITVSSQPCTENVTITDRQRLTIIAPQGVWINGGSGPSMLISGSTGIQLVLLGFQNGQTGLVIQRNSEVRVHGCTIQNNAGAGIRVIGNSTVDIDGLIQGNGGAGVRADDSTVRVFSSQILANAANGIALRRSRARLVGGEGAPNVISGNGAGVLVDHGASAEFDAPNLIQNNQSNGVNVQVGGSAEFFGDLDSHGSPLPNVISGNPFIGLNITGGQVVMFNANQIQNNGSSGDQFNAGVRSDDNGSFITAGSGDILISNNTGPGIDATTGGNVDLTGTVVTNNTGDGVRLQGNTQVAFFPPNTNTVSGNGGKSISCDGTSMFLGDRTGLINMACTFSPFDTVNPRRHMTKQDAKGGDN
jgi:hypothetical protein